MTTSDVAAAPGEGAGIGSVAPGHPTALLSPDVPSRATGVQLIGELPGSGYRKPPSLVRRADGQIIQLTRLLYLVLQAANGQRSYAEIADTVSSGYGRAVSTQDVAHLVDEKLRPLGVLKLADGSEPEVKKSNPLLGLRLRYVVSDPATTRRITRPFSVLFHPIVVLPMIAAFIATCAWVFLEKGLASATHEAFDKPGLLLLVFAITIISAGFHEFGHAAACRYGGATPGVMGAGLYLVWPAFYTEVSDSYRLGRAGRVRVDLGGLYFNAIVAVAMVAAWAISRWDAILLVIALQILQMVRQLAPFVRFDGYHILADITGVPDLYAHIKPTLRSLLPGHWRGTQSSALRPWARGVVSLWVLLVVPLLLAMLVLMVVTLPRVLATAGAAIDKHWQLLGHFAGAGDLAAAGVRLLSVLAIGLTMLGTVYLLTRVVRQVTLSTWRATSGQPVRRAAAVVTATALLAGLAAAWWPQPGKYRPIEPYERGTLLDVLPVANTIDRPLLREGQVAQARTVWASAVEPPNPGRPQLALVLIPKSGDREPWVFPFDRPDAPAEGGNQALAVNVTDGSTVYDVAFALVWASGESVLNRNEAYAFASCRECRTIAIGFQVVLVLGQADLLIPQNISAAVNYSCVQCLTYALAKQLVITLPNGLSAASTAKLTELWEQIEAFAATIEDVPIGRIRAELETYEAAIRAIVEEEASDSGSPDDGEREAPASTPTPVHEHQSESSPRPSSSGSSGSRPSAESPPSADPSVAETAESSPSPSATSSSAEP